MPRPISESIRLKISAIATIVFRNAFLLINGIIFAVVALLIVFGSAREGIFLGVITVLNMLIGIAQEIRSWLALEKLQLQTALRVIRVSADGTESIVLAENVLVGDTVKLKSGDQIPCDGRLKSSKGFEVNEALITGESVSISRNIGEEISAGSIVTSGLGVMIAEKVFTESKIAEMTKTIKKYAPSISPIQRSINTIIKYTGYGLLGIIAFVVIRGFLIGAPTIQIIQNVGALTSALLPQGMVVIITLLFSYGAAHLHKRGVLVQEINAVEKVGRIRNLCIDKTGTLTDNNLSLESIHQAKGLQEGFSDFAISTYLEGSGDTSQTMMVLKDNITGQPPSIVSDNISFSSARQFGAVLTKKGDQNYVIIAGAPDVLLSHCSLPEEKVWLKDLIDKELNSGKRLVCFAGYNADKIPNDLKTTQLEIIALCVIKNDLREGIQEAIQFFQSRGVAIRVISGDSADTVRSVAMAAGIQNTDKYVNGDELEKWSKEDFTEKISQYSIFARIKPDQKERIIEALKTVGFTAMIGDGANDALAIKKADLGIAMFDGAQATRQVASMILTKNNFLDLPGGVVLAENIIENIEICASIFFNQAFIGLLLFLVLTGFGYSFPLTPLNITFINYFTVGFPGFLIFYWIIRPVHQHVFKPKKDFLKRVLPFAFVSAIFQAVVVIFAFWIDVMDIGVRYPQAQVGTSTVLLCFIILGFLFFIFTPRVYSGLTTALQRWQFVLLATLETIFLVVLLNIFIVKDFFNIKNFSAHTLYVLSSVIIVYAIIQYFLAKKFSKLANR
ncbi:MAG: HAD-IC family P-type ATPase [bacterium]